MSGLLCHTGPLSVGRAAVAVCPIWFVARGPALDSAKPRTGRKDDGDSRSDYIFSPTLFLDTALETEKSDIKAFQKGAA